MQRSNAAKIIQGLVRRHQLRKRITPEKIAHAAELRPVLYGRLTGQRLYPNKGHHYIIIGGKKYIVPNENVPRTKRNQGLGLLRRESITPANYNAYNNLNKLNLNNRLYEYFREVHNLPNNNSDPMKAIVLLSTYKPKNIEEKANMVVSGFALANYNAPRGFRQRLANMGLYNNTSNTNYNNNERLAYSRWTDAGMVPPRRGQINSAKLNQMKKNLLEHLIKGQGLTRNYTNEARIIQRRYKTHKAREAFKQHWLKPGGGYHRFISGNEGSPVNNQPVPTVPQLLRTMANAGVAVAPTNAGVEKNRLGRVIHTGPRGGRYILVNGRKTYKFTRA
jgi:hypothetical protein